MTEANDIKTFTLRNANGMTVDISNFGATITSVNVPDREGKFDDVVLGFKDPNDYRTKAHPFFGGVVGRYGNRIAKGRFSLEGKEYDLVRNNGENHLHGGNKGFDRALWEVESANERSITLTHISPDGDEGYPGELKVRVTYTLTNNNEVRINYGATTDKATPVNLTNHSYFNLAGEGAGSVANHLVTINASKYVPVDDGCIPTGIDPVDGTPLDLRQPTPLMLGFASSHVQLGTVGHGYDHTFILDSDSPTGLRKAATVVDPDSGRTLEVETTEPGVQFYTGNSLDGSFRSKDGTGIYAKNNAFCLETQHYPDSPNHPEFPTTILRPGEKYESETVYRFGVQKGLAVAA